MAETAVRTPARVPGTNAKNSGVNKLDPNFYHCKVEKETPDNVVSLDEILDRDSPTRVGHKMYEEVPEEEIPFSLGNKKWTLVRCRIEDKDIENNAAANFPVGQIDPEVAARRNYAFAGGDFDERPVDPSLVPGFSQAKKTLDQIGVGRPDEFNRTREDWMALARTNAFKPKGKEK